MAVGRPDMGQICKKGLFTLNRGHLVNRGEMRYNEFGFRDRRLTVRFEKKALKAQFIAPSGKTIERPVEIRTNPITGRTCRITFSRSLEKERGASRLPTPPPDAEDNATCPFCRPQLFEQTPRLDPAVFKDERLVYNTSILFPNLFPYGRYSAVSLFDDRHYVEIGQAAPDSYQNSLVNCHRYLKTLLGHDSQAVYMAITQNHLPSAGGSLLHPHLQVHADRLPSNHHRWLDARTSRFKHKTNRRLFSEYLACEKQNGERYIGRTGQWEWLAAFAPEGFFEIWGLLPGQTRMTAVNTPQWGDLARGIISSQRFYRSLNRNGYNLGLLAVETPQSCLEMRAVLTVRSNYNQWVRNDHTGFELMLGDMATFTAPEETAALARPFWTKSQ